MKNVSKDSKTKAWLLIAVAMLSMVYCVQIKAQNVTIRKANGSTLASVKNGGIGDTFFKLGGFATWKHKQLSLIMTTADSDKGELLPNGQLANPANNIFKRTNEDALILGRGRNLDCYVSITLPKGFRFTSYTIKFSRNVDIDDGRNGRASFGETDDKFTSYKSGYYITGLNYSASAGMQSITRNSITDMGNTLYFKLSNDGNNRAFITLHHIELGFTAEADYTPVFSKSNANGVSAVDIPFATSKVDYGEFSNNYYQGTNRMSYSSANVTDLDANLILYEQESVKAVPNNGFDGTGGNVVDYKGGTIYSVLDYFKLGKADNNEQIYYIETPTYVTLPDPDKTKSPIGYRIVGAEIEGCYNAPTVGTFDMFYLHNGETYDKKYMGLSYTNYTEPTAFIMDNNGYIRAYSTEYEAFNNYKNYLCVSGVSSGKPFLSTATVSGQYLKLERVGNNLKVVEGSYNGVDYKGKFLCYDGTSPWTLDDGTRYRRVEIADLGTTATASTTVDYESKPFTINIYSNKTKYGEKDEIIETLTLNDNNKTAKSTLLLNGLNNDAIKFGVVGEGLVKAKLTIQALNPFIDRLNIVCQEITGNGRKLSQLFTATDFEVHGGKFVFYVPTDFTLPCRFTFENLYSKYGDDTYYNGVGLGNSRYNFVMSTYSQAYQNNYDSDPNHTYIDKVKTEKPGSKAFIFSNSEELNNSGSGQHFKEYPFTIAKYGRDNFQNFDINDNEDKEKTAYLFTNDETRYNIAPTTATQHKYYSYYDMTVSLQKKNYDPKFEWTKIYDESKTLYMDENGAPAEKSQWGLKLKTTEAGPNGESGYLTVKQVLDGIEKGLSDSGNQSKGLKGKDQILYVDGSELWSIVEEEQDNGSTTIKNSLSNIRKGLGSNAIVYLPKDVTTEVSDDYDNYAYNTEVGFVGANNFVITDRKPFYAPYEIKLHETNTCTYSRELEVKQNEDTPLAIGTIILPFDLKLEDGVHVNADGSKPFSVHEMQATNCISNEPVEAGQEDVGNVYFPNISKEGIELTKPNTPYIVRVAADAAETNAPFVATQNGATIAASTGMNSSNYTFTGAKSTGTTPKGESFTFQSLGNYSGAKLAISDPVNYFYFSHNYFVCTKNLDSYLEYAYVLPFRAYYSTSNTSSRMGSFGVIFGEGEGYADPTGIYNAGSAVDLIVAPGTGNITMMSSVAQNVDIYNMNGIRVNSVKLSAGESKTVSIPTGMYIVNNTKIIVR